MNHFYFGHCRDVWTIPSPHRRSVGDSIRLGRRAMGDSMREDFHLRILKRKLRQVLAVVDLHLSIYIASHGIPVCKILSCIIQSMCTHARHAFPKVNPPLDWARSQWETP